MCVQYSSYDGRYPNFIIDPPEAEVDKTWRMNRQGFIQGLPGFRVRGSGFGVQGLGFRVRSSGFRVGPSM